MPRQNIESIKSENKLKKESEKIIRIKSEKIIIKKLA
jgi:hypothetical protein